MEVSKPKAWFRSFSNNNLHGYLKPDCRVYVDQHQASVYNAGTTQDSLTYPILTDLRSCQTVDVNLTLAGSTLQCSVPVIVERCCRHIAASEKPDGLFRVNGSVKTVRATEQILAADVAYSFDGLNSYDISMLLKRYLSFADPLVPRAISETLKNIAENGSGNIELYAATLAQIPTRKVHTLLYVLHFLHALALPEVVLQTRMTPHNLAKIFQLSLFRFEITGNMSAEDLMGSCRVFEETLQCWIEDFESLFTAVCARLREVPEVKLPVHYESRARSLESLHVTKRKNRRLSLFLDRSVSASASILEEPVPLLPERPQQRAVSDPVPRDKKDSKVKLGRRLSVRFGLSRMAA
ncbi:unnamed protein product [Kuraishia capsulata CBS 1993]|uniref:Rho-GAP domain-containing protein n=1 Tax=Kuraishia capsulata CBS 1993 TaxID=1382522 RepID=W6MSA0_9ASCO|nr:uncharacterized protein KUCA_T00005561001 [Kuraishia capsulata CBS 1993]CDK29569.1 unnamed protein product [Kuraishia capsulata CBS 1993]